MKDLLISTTSKNIPYGTFKRITLITLFINIPFALSLLVGILSPLKSGVEALYILIPVIIIGWVYAVFYLFYFPYYVIRYKSYDSMTKLGAVVYSAILLVVFGMALTVISKIQ